MTLLVYRPIEAWPGVLNLHPIGASFRSTWTQTQDLLDRELRMLRVDRAVLQLALTERDLRIDGSVRANARPAHEGVILSFDHPKHGPVSYPCDTYATTQVWAGKSYQTRPGWQHNVRAIALTLEALRAIGRFGAAQTDQQYAGWKQLGAGIPMPGPAGQMTVEDAARFLHDRAEWSGEWEPLSNASHIVQAYRAAAKRLHPDVGGDPALFRRLNEARDLLAQARRRHS